MRHSASLGGAGPGPPREKVGAERSGGTQAAKDKSLKGGSAQGPVTCSTAPPRISSAPRARRASPTAQPPQRQRRRGQAGPGEARRGGAGRGHDGEENAAGVSTRSLLPDGNCSSGFGNYISQ